MRPLKKLPGTVLSTGGARGVGATFANGTSGGFILVADKWVNALAVTANRILGTTAAQVSDTDILTFAAQPDFPRNVTCVADAAATSHLYIYGYDQFGAAIMEDLTLNGATPVVGSKCFAQVTKITQKARSGAFNFTVGIGVKMGLSRHILDNLALTSVGNVYEATRATIDATNNTADFSTDPDGSKTHVLVYTSSDVD